MKKRYVVFIILIIVICLSVFLIINNKPKEKEDNDVEKEFTYTPLIYKICDDDSCMHLMGSIHVGDSRVTNFDKKVNDIYKNSDYLAVEVDTTDITVDQTVFMLPDNQTIDELINDELKQKFIDFSSKHRLFMYDTFKIFTLGYLQNYLSLLPSIELGLMSGGVDEYFMELAHEDNKKIISLETYESQLAFFIDYSDAFYIKQIEDIIDNYDKQKRLTKDLYEAYLTGDKEKIEKVLNEEDDENIEMTEEEERYAKAMLYDRNVLMAENVEKFLAENKNVFMIVGEAHVLLEDGIIDLIKDNNYKISIVR